ncbi:hypothetical protein [Methylosinus sp. Ce-a6]|uniref:hypothetical protein n=1 Tax=Methylosinus sp. Ce-a6 TaxID=2172005 RepID=UPI00135A6686|nr:hypothetical protein [Methylosinus sp. Ce-a6]
MPTCITALVAPRAELRVFRDTVSTGNWLNIGAADGRVLLRLNITDATPDELDEIAAAFCSVKGERRRIGDEQRAE